MHPRHLAGPLLAAWLLTGCVSSAQIEALQERVTSLEKERRALLGELTAERDQMRALRKETEASTTFLRRNGARLGAEVEKARTDAQRIGGELEVIKRRLDLLTQAGVAQADKVATIGRRLGNLIADLRDRAGITILALPRDLPGDAAGFQALARKAYESDDVRTADAVAIECIRRFAKTAEAGRCGILRAQIAFEEHRFADASQRLIEVHDAFDGKPEAVVGKALLLSGAVLEAQGRCKDASGVYGYMADVFKRKRKAYSKKAAKRGKRLTKRCTEGVANPPAKRAPKAPDDDTADEPAGLAAPVSPTDAAPGAPAATTTPNNGT
jgi:outer membrane murein-binding lipoprotein Lpp